LTRHSSEPLYGTQLRSALLWVVALPLVAAVLALLLRAPMILLVVPLAWLLQSGRIALRRRPLALRSLAYAAMIMLAKIPEVAGAMRYAAIRARGGGERS